VRNVAEGIEKRIYNEPPIILGSLDSSKNNHIFQKFILANYDLIH